MAYGDDITDPTPTVSVTAGPAYAQQINTLLASLLAVVESKVTPGGFAMSSDLTFRSADGSAWYGPTNQKYSRFADQSALLPAATYPGALYTYLGELYYNDSAGNQVKVTNGGLVSAAAGNITGAGYGAGGKEVNWDDANLTYRMRSGTATDSFADVSLDDLLLNDGSGNFVRVTAQAMGADYTLTLPAAVPASNNTMVQMSTGGTLSASATPTIDGLTSVGLITAQVGVTASANQDMTVSGTGRYNHGDIDFNYSPLPAIGISGAAPLAVFNYPGGIYLQLPAANTICAVPLSRLPAGMRLRTVTVHWRSGAAGTPVFRMYRGTASGTVQIGADWGTVAAGAGVDTADVSAALNHTILSTANYHLYIDAGAVNDIIAVVQVTMDQP